MGRCKLDPSFNAPGFKNFNLTDIKLAFNLNLTLELAPLHIGEVELQAKFEECGELIKRDIVFVASLFL